MDYLVDEVLRQLPTRTQSFLLQSAVLDRMCAPLCQAVVGGGDGAWLDGGETGPEAPDPGVACQMMLEEIERVNLFLVPLDDDRRWFRYHQLFADVLRNRLRQLKPNLVSELHQRASAWFEEQGLMPRGHPACPGRG